VGGGPNGRNRYEWAEQLGIDILAGAYNIVLFTMEDNNAGSEGYSDEKAKILERIEGYFAEHTAYLLFRNQMFSYAVIVKGEPDSIEAKSGGVRECARRDAAAEGNEGRLFYLYRKAGGEAFHVEGKAIRRQDMHLRSAILRIRTSSITGPKMDVKGRRSVRA